MSYNRYDYAVGDYYKDKGLDVLVVSWKDGVDPDDVLEDVIDTIESRTYVEVVEGKAVESRYWNGLVIEVPRNSYKNALREDDSPVSLFGVIKDSLSGVVDDVSVGLNAYGSSLLREINDYYGIKVKEDSFDEFYFE